jgi:lipopolysaccharide export system protein LptA
MLVANSFPKNFLCGLSATLLLIPAIAPSAAVNQFPIVRKDIPIVIDADRSEFDYANNRLLFHGLRLDQGDLGIVANVAETEELDFADGEWILTGDVIIETATGTLWCDHAVLTFTGYELAAAELSGLPARFEQIAVESGKMNSGEGNNIIYKLTAGTLQLIEKAHFFDGANKVSGDLITYDLRAQNLKADAGDSGPVKILIESPNQQKEKSAQP